MFSIPSNATAVTEVAAIIQAAIAPVFLLAGIGAFLNVCAGRLSRIVDRARTVEPLVLNSRGPEHDRYQREIRTLDRRMALVGWAIWLTVLAALLICLVVVLLFSGALTSGTFGTAISILFIGCMIALGAAFAVFLVETQVGSRAVRVRNAVLEHKAEDPS